jgi:hypothetical protein
MSVSIADMIAYARARGISVADISDANLTIICNQILNKYCGAKPIHVFVANMITTVADQPYYDLPAGTIGVDVVFWSSEHERTWPALASDLTGMYGVFQDILPSTSGMTELDFESPEQALRWDALVHSWNEQWAGSWRLENTGTAGTQQIWLSPCPGSTGDTVAGTIWKARPTALIDSSMQATLNDVVLAYAQSDKVTTLAMLGKVRLGDYAQESGTGAGDVLKNANDKIKEFELSLSAPFIGSLG